MIAPGYESNIFHPEVIMKYPGEFNPGGVAKMNLEAWFYDLTSRRSAELSRVVRVVGIREAHPGARLEYGRIVIEAHPAPEFQCSGPGLLGPGGTEEFLSAAIFGVLDVVLAAEPAPLRNFALDVVEIHAHPIDSSAMAFRRAGRDAGRKLLDAAGLA